MLGATNRRGAVTCGVVGVLAAMVLVATSCSSPASRVTAAAGARIRPSPGCDGRGAAGAGRPVQPGANGTIALDAAAGGGTYSLWVPAGERTGMPTVSTGTKSRTVLPAPVILLFYGFGSDPAAFTTLTGLPARGAAAGSIVVVPHTQQGEFEWQFDGTGTDAGFVSAVLTQVEDAYCVDEGKVFATGFSAGAAFSIVYACTHRDRIAAVATVAVEFVLGCTAPLGILAFHGTADPEVPYRDGAVGRSLPGVKVSGTQRNMAAWAGLDRCRPAPATTRVGSQVVHQVWQGCAPGTSVQLVTLLGGSHTWPGADPGRGVGPTRQQVDATGEILDFFGVGT